jgi:glycosyltransferase involved in cell wall biosynthesis
MSYIIMGDLFTFPEGEAATNRVHTYAKGLSANGREVHVICLRNDYLSDADGATDGIKYYRPFGQTVRNRYFLVRNWKKVMKFVKTFRLVRSINRRRKIQAVIAYTGLPFTLIFTWFVAVTIRSMLIQEISEHPLRYHQEGKIKRAIGKLLIWFQTNLNDGIFCISHFLMDFYREKGFPPERLLLVPSTVDPGRFISLNGTPFSFPYVGYFGMLTFSRDRLDMLIEAFAGIAAKYPEYKLVLGGPEYGSELGQIKGLASKLGITERMIILEYMPREKIIRYIVNSDILVMVRGNDIKAHASFPSKLTEYLATSKPVISVNVGEISRFLTDGVNAYLVEPGNSIQLAEKIDLVLSDYKSALVTAGRGRQLAETVFNYDYQAKRIIPFVESLYTRKIKN